MSAEKIINKAFGSIPKEVSMHIGDNAWIPTVRGIKYYSILYVAVLQQNF